MAGQRIDIMELRTLIVLKNKGLSNRKVASMLKINRKTVDSYILRFKALELSWEELLQLEEVDLRDLFTEDGQTEKDRYEALSAEFTGIQAKMTTPGATLQELWREYLLRHPGGYRYTQFTWHYRRWKGASVHSGKLTHRAAEKLFVDFCGKKLHYIDRETGEQVEVEVFVAVLPCSQYTFVMAVPSQKREDLIACLSACLEWLGGVPQAIVSDNLKSAVSKGSKYAPVINKTLADFALHYGCVVDPARPYHPQDKSLVERSVTLVYQRIYYPLSHHTFFDVKGINDAIRELLPAYNDYLFSHGDGSRRSQFIDLERTHLSPLPGAAYSLRYFRRAKVQKTRPNHKGRAKLPEHLPVEEIEIHPEGDLSEMVCIGREITEELECEPARFYIKRYIRYKYAAKSGEGVKIAELPERVIDKGIPGAGLLAMVLTDKYVDHLPLYRQKQRFARENIRIASSTIEGWTREALIKLHPLYEQLIFDTKAKGYLQVDESPIKVLDSDKKGAAHQGYYWVYHAPLDGTVLFDYSPTRGRQAPLPILGSFRGYLQTDGYAVYEKYARSKNVVHLACWAHARREFERALDNDKVRAEKALLMIQRLYAVERQAREEKLAAEQIKELRLTESLPVINELGRWIFEEIKSTLPKSQIGKAMAYAYARWDGLSAYLYDGNLQIDNNLVENAIRPLALGRKNYLFAGSHEAAQRAAMIYSFFAICKKHEVNPFHWLKYTLENIMAINHKNLKDLYPQNYKNMVQKSNM